MPERFAFCISTTDEADDEDERHDHEERTDHHEFDEVVDLVVAACVKKAAHVVLLFVRDQELSATHLFLHQDQRQLAQFAHRGVWIR